MPKDDLVYIGHMSDRVGQVLAKVRGKSRAEFDADDNLRLAVAHLVQDVGEAANRVSPEFRRRHPDVPWSHIVGMRHKIVHDYLDIDFDIVWDVATVDFPALASGLASLVPPGDAEVREAAVAWGADPVGVKSNDFGRLLPEPAIEVPAEQVREFCGRWKIIEFALFGSVLRDDFRPDSDVDVLVRFQPDAPWSLFDLGDMQAELERIFGRKVDLVEKEAIEQSRNPFRRRHILGNHRVIYAA